VLRTWQWLNRADDWCSRNCRPVADCLAVAFAIFYNSQSPTTSNSNAAVANVADGKQAAATPRKAERVAINNSAMTNAKKRRATASTPARSLTIRKGSERPRARQRGCNEKKREAVAMNSRPAATKSQKALNTQQSRPRRPVGAPALACQVLNWETMYQRR